MAPTNYEIAVLPGDGIGPEVMESALTILSKLANKAGRSFSLRSHPAGATHYMETGDALPRPTLEACRSADAILFGAMGLPETRGADGTEIVPQLDLRFDLDLYAGVRPIRTFQGLPGPLIDSRSADIDIVLVRENTEGLFYARGRSANDGDEAVLDTMRISRRGTDRISEFVFRLAEKRKANGHKGHVTNVDKSNVLGSMAFWRAVVHERAKQYPDISVEDVYVDAMALNLVLRPWQYDVIVTENMFGDILSDLIASLVGGMGMAPSADIGDEHALFQPAHGTAPDIAGKNIANPTAMILSTAMMLEWLAERNSDPALTDAAQALETTVRHVFQTGTIRPFDFGGHSTTTDITNAVMQEL